MSTDVDKATLHRRAGDKMGSQVSLTLAVSLIAVVVVIAVWDTAVVFGPWDSMTVSEIVYGWAQKFPPFVAGVFFVAGHLFWPVRPQ